MSPDGERDCVEREWVSVEFCAECDRDTDHQFLEFRDEPVVESECSACKVIRVREDRE